ncbi:hypothetical protein NC652_027148 [Populus alba x Populus x berolinensis]|uniref:Uncharacterized protein n=1 Tax=Populus alba x Populus x berolinensis TaxID=444605 RepID=A0AAD6M3Y7_9ROSI|nr:hypothetical protein NC652_027148 [Populus alba x Populus x berolinensis]KAJ6978476.1 hypothetical protein NC653_026782 [Populus alba x Populus x berolinensis]KAJ6978528.1 hypothetical protein NC653_026830 [Populus alba x Populus x berolinensis]KAJ6978533.1 hypothetical protein NC653_026835 [Populus alba x Populus x berolinensis]
MLAASFMTQETVALRQNRMSKRIWLVSCDGSRVPAAWQFWTHRCGTPVKDAVLTKMVDTLDTCKISSSSQIFKNSSTHLLLSSYLYDQCLRLCIIELPNSLLCR